MVTYLNASNSYRFLLDKNSRQRQHIRLAFLLNGIRRLVFYPGSEGIHNLGGVDPGRSVQYFIAFFDLWEKSSVVDPLWFQCGSGSGCGSRKANQCGSRRIRIRVLIRLLSHKRLNFNMKNILNVDKRSKKQTTRFIWKCWPIFELLDPDLHSQYGSGSKTSKRMRIQEDPDPHHWRKE